jgi:hypothetical protein
MHLAATLRHLVATLMHLVATLMHLVATLMHLVWQNMCQLVDERTTVTIAHRRPPMRIANTGDALRLWALYMCFAAVTTKSPRSGCGDDNALDGAANAIGSDTDELGSDRS